MSLSLAEIRLVFEALREALVAGAVQKVFEADARTFVLQVRQPGKTHFVLFSTEPGYARMHETPGKPTQPPHPSAFTMQLRKWLQGARIEDARLAPEDRIVLLDVTVSDPDYEGDERPPKVSATLVVELTGYHGNAFLLDAEHRIRGEQHRHEDARGLAPGRPYELPPKPEDTGLGGEVRWSLDTCAPDERSRLVEEHYARVRHEDALQEATRDLRRRLKTAIKRLRRRRKHVEQDLERAEAAETYRRRGELLQSAYGQDVPRGAESVEVPDFYREDMPMVEIPLDPARTLQQNIARYFHEYRRMSGAIERIEERLLETMELLERAEQARTELDLCTELEAVEALTTQLLSEKIIARDAAPGRKQRQGPKPPYREFRTRHGATVLVGRGPKRNDELTTRVARGRDLWLHARDWAGAHVLLRMDKDAEPDGQDLLDAAMLAAHFSRGREDTFVDVTYTRAKHVRKPKGAAPGLVTVADASAITVRRDPARLEELLASEVPT